MKKSFLFVIVIFLFSCFNLYAADGDLIVNGNVGIGTTPATKLDVGGKFQVDSNGNVTKINNVTTSFPAAQGAAGQYLQNSDGNGTLQWAAAGGGSVADASISQSKLKTSSGEITGTDGNYTLPGGEYGFYPQLKNPEMVYQAFMASALTSASYVTNIYLRTGGGTNYVRQRYVTSSGEVFWIFILRAKVDYEEYNSVTKLPRTIHKGNTLSMWAAPDHPCFGNGGKPLLTPHPFPGYNATTQEIIVINPTKGQVAEIEARRLVDADDEPDLSFLEVIQKFYAIDETSTPAWPTEEVTVGLPNGHDWINMVGRDVRPLKKVIPQPERVLIKSLKLKK